MIIKADKIMNKILTDCHLHSSFSFDSECNLLDIINTAIKNNYTHICLTDHYDLDFPKEYNMDFTFDLDIYFKTLKEAVKKYSESITILSGIELGLMPHLNNDINSLIKGYDFDYIIGSTHIVDNMDPYYPEYWEQNDISYAYKKYFTTSIENIENNDKFDAFGHLDYISRYDATKSYTPQQYQTYIDEILKLLIEKDKALEINSAGLKKNLQLTNPDIYTLKRYKKLGGKLITIGSDAHDATSIGYGFDTVYNMLKEADFNHYNLYINRVPYEIGL